MKFAQLPKWLLLLTLAQWPLADDSFGQSCSIEVRETAGIQRFGYPLTFQFEVPKKPDGAGGYLLRTSDRAINAQFTTIREPTTEKHGLCEVDFGVDLLPHETRVLRVDYSRDIQTEAVAGRGLRVERAQNKLRVIHPSLEFAVNEDLKGLLDSLRINGDDWLEGLSRGLVLQLRDGSQRPFVAAAASGQNRALQVIKSGPLAVRVQCSGNEQLAGGKSLHSSVQLDFPLGKSWVRVDWVVDDPNDLVEQLAAELRLRLEQSAKEPVLGDFGANGWTYATLRSDESFMFQAGLKQGSNDPSAWRVDREQRGKAIPYVLPSVSGPSFPVQGWAHLMDRQRCTAIAIDRFAESTQDSIRLSAGGQIALQRKFAAAPASTKQKQFTFWLHAVIYPPQVGAATSPQSMQTPPEVSVSKAGN